MKHCSAVNSIHSKFLTHYLKALLMLHIIWSIVFQFSQCNLYWPCQIIILWHLLTDRLKVSGKFCHQIHIFRRDNLLSMPSWYIVGCLSVHNWHQIYIKCTSYVSILDGFQLCLFCSIDLQMLHRTTRIREILIIDKIIHAPIKLIKDCQFFTDFWCDYFGYFIELLKNLRKFKP